MNNSFLSVKSVFENCLKSNSTAFVGVALISLALTGCGGGGGSKSAASAPLTAFTGTAAVGTALAGATVSGTCVTGTPSATTDNYGKYTLQLAGLTLPCILSVPTGLTDPVFGSTTTLYSVVNSGQAIANITPITQLILANALGTGNDLSTATPTSPAVANKLTAANIAIATTLVTNALTTAGINIPGNPLTSAFTATTTLPSNDALDNSIDLFLNSIRQAQIINAATSLSALSTASINGTLGTYITSAHLASNSAAGQMILIIGNFSYDMQTLPLMSGIITKVTNSEIDYATNASGKMALIGNFQYSGSSLTTFNNCSLGNCGAGNLPGVTGNITSILQKDANDNLVMGITKLNINVATVESLIEQQAPLYKIWQLLAESNGGLLVTNNGVTLSCPTPPSGANVATITTTNGNQNIEQLFINRCVP